MRRRKSTLQLIEAEYSDAVVAGEFERAEGWFAVARYAATQDPKASVEHDPDAGATPLSRDEISKS